MSVTTGTGSLVSVVIPSYNRAYCLERTVDSVLGQTHPEVEVVIVDDGSTDNTGDLVQRRWGSDPRVVYHRQTNAGISGARNAGLDRVRGDYVALLDSDDEWMPWKLELQLGCMRAHPEVGMTWTDMIAVGPEGEVVSQAYLREMYSAYRWFPTAGSLFRAPGKRIDRLAPRAAEVAPGRNFYAGDIGARMLMGNMVHTSTVVMTRARAEAVKSFREDLRPCGEDYEFHLRTTREGPVGYLDVASIKYQRGRPDQATVSPNAIHMARNFLRVIEPILLDERDRLDLPRDMQDTVLAEAHAWVGEMLLERGESGEARRELGRSLVRRPWQPRTARLMVAACLPAAVRDGARQAFRAARGALAAQRRA
jgi:GT2 family glycosyltransferase